MQKVIHKFVVYLVSLVLVAAVLASVFFFYEKKQEKQMETARQEEEATKETAKAALTEEEIEKIWKEHKVEKEQETIAETSEERATAEATTSVIDWEGLWEINSDVYAWITVPGTEIDYPILQHPTDDTYYLNYNIDGSYGYPGCIYTEKLNSKEFTDNNTVIYGHNMKNGTMFAGLHKFRETDFFASHDKVYIYTPEKTLEYTIFAAYLYDDRHILYSFDFTNQEVYENYLDTIVNMRDLNAQIRNEVEVTGENKIITLATCVSKDPNSRLLVQAVSEE